VSPEAEMNQADFLSRIRVARPRTGSADTRAVVENVPGDWGARANRVRGEAFRRWGELLPRFSAEVEAVGGVVHRAEVEELAAVIGGIARGRGLSRVVTWSEQALGIPGLLAQLEAEGLALEDASQLGRSAAGGEQISYGGLAWTEIGLTGVDFAIADSGSLVLHSGVGKDRLVSCLPAIHLAILRPGQLLESLEEVGILLEDASRRTTPGDFPRVIDFITGPSRTADIEMSLTRGIHGPKEVHVLAAR
jgi:L-lactate dehydrogenase complex protein LldG